MSFIEKFTFQRTENIYLKAFLRQVIFWQKTAHFFSWCRIFQLKFAFWSSFGKKKKEKWEKKFFNVKMTSEPYMGSCNTLLYLMESIDAKRRCYFLVAWWIVSRGRCFVVISCLLLFEELICLPALKPTNGNVFFYHVIHIFFSEENFFLRFTW